MTFEIDLSPRASRDLGRMRRGISPGDRKAIDDAVQGLGLDPRPVQATQLVDSLLWRMRVRGYRIIFQIDDVASVVYIVAVVRRTDATYSDV